MAETGTAPLECAVCMDANMDLDEDFQLEKHAQGPRVRVPVFGSWCTAYVITVFVLGALFPRLVDGTTHEAWLLAIVVPLSVVIEYARARLCPRTCDE
jgi:hypothetical protein